MRAIAALVVLFVSLSAGALDAAPVPEGGVPFAAEDAVGEGDGDGEADDNEAENPNGSPWLLSVEDHAALPDGLSLAGKAISRLEIYPTGVVLLGGEAARRRAPAR